MILPVNSLITRFCKFAAILLLFWTSLCLAGGWQLQKSNTNENLRGVWFADSLNGWACGTNGTILHTSTGGDRWESQENGVTVDLEDVFFWDLNNGWIVGDSGTILYTSDMGEHWTLQNTPFNTFLTMVQFISADSGYVHGDQETSLNTTDGGNTWQGHAGDSTSGDYAGFYISADLSNYIIVLNYYYPTNYSIIWRSFDGGATWYALPFPYSHLIRDLHGLREHNFLFAAAENGRMYTSYMGDSWDVGLTTDSLNLNGVTSEGDTWKLWAVGEHGWIVFSEDTGKTWITSPLNAAITANLNELSFPAEGYGWAVGDSGTILHYWNPPVNVKDEKQYSTDSPTLFELFSPYPNPFNNSTVVYYRLFKPGSVLLKLYDITGQPVATLVDTWQDGGEYQVQWQGKNYQGLEVTSGIYIIRLQVDGFQEVKKVALLK